MTTESIYVLMPKVMSSIGVIGKERHNQTQNFRFRGIDDVMNALHEPLTNHGVFFVPEVLESEYYTYTTSKGTGMRNCTLKVRYTFYGPAGDSISGVGMGEASDSGDKATSKALAMALKYALLQTFCIPTEELGQEDADGAAHQRAGDAWNAPTNEPACPTCGSQVWDNTNDPDRGKRPKWKCKDKYCGWASWNDDPFTPDVQTDPAPPSTSLVADPHPSEPGVHLRSSTPSDGEHGTEEEAGFHRDSPASSPPPAQESFSPLSETVKAIGEYIAGDDIKRSIVKAKVRAEYVRLGMTLPNTLEAGPDYMEIEEDILRDVLHDLDEEAKAANA